VAKPELIVPGQEAALAQKTEPTREELHNNEQAREENQALRDIAKRHKPEGLDYLGSFAVHVYQHPISLQAFYLTQLSNISHVPELYANEAIKLAASKLMQVYSRKVPSKRR
jgi:hypothetical protein